MGLYDIVKLDDDIELPGFEGNHTELEWQSKNIDGLPFLQLYKIEDDTLLKRKQSHRDATKKELNKKANKRGYDSWTDWKNDSDTTAPLDRWKKVVDEEWWVNMEHHGSFEIHTSTSHNDDFEEDIFWSYEIRFTKGELVDILLLKKNKINN